MMKKTTGELQKTLENSGSLSDFFCVNAGELFVPAPQDYLNALLVETGLTKAQVIKWADIEKSYAYQLFSGTRMKPSRDKCIRMCFGFKLDPERAQRLLFSFGLAPLYVRDRRDAALLFCLQKKFGVIEANEMLFDMGEQPLE